MSFQFKKDGKPFFRFRSEYLDHGKPLVSFSNADGENNFVFYPETNSDKNEEVSQLLERVELCESA